MTSSAAADITEGGFAENVMQLTAVAASALISIQQDASSIRMIQAVAKTAWECCLA